MKRVELEVEHSFNNKFVGRHRLKQDDGFIVLGSSREADIRLLGGQVNDIHAYLEFDDGQWNLIDAGSAKGTYVKKKPVVTLPINNALVANIGEHSIRVIPKLIESDLFSTEKKNSEKTGSLCYQQVVIRKKGFVLDSKLLPSDKSFVYRHGGKDHNLAAPKGEAWTVTEFDSVVVQQRLVYTSKIQEETKGTVQNMIDPELKKPMAIVLILFIIGTLFFSIGNPAEKEEEKKIDLKKNKYTRMIIDAKSVRKKRQAAAKARSSIKHKRKAPSAKAKNARPSRVAKAKGKTPKVVSKLKTAGLSKLLGKISKRAAKNATFVKTAGKLAESGNTGRAFAAVASTKGIGKKFGSGGKGVKVNGVATGGKGSGGSINGIGGLSAVGVGTSNVGILEEETEIQGGLDKEVIARVIQSHLGEIRYCYERQLSANPDLYGKVQVKFTINGTGRVGPKAVGLTTLNNAMVEGCILRRVAKWKFPTPKGGTSVFVTYPFLFKSSN